MSSKTVNKSKRKLLVFDIDKNIASILQKENTAQEVNQNLLLLTRILALLLQSTVCIWSTLLLKTMVQKNGKERSDFLGIFSGKTNHKK